MPLSLHFALAISGAFRSRSVAATILIGAGSLIQWHVTMALHRRHGSIRFGAWPVGFSTIRDGSRLAISTGVLGDSSVDTLDGAVDARNVRSAMSPLSLAAWQEFAIIVTCMKHQRMVHD